MNLILKVLKNMFVYLFLLILFVFRGTFVNLVENVGALFTDNKGKEVTEIKILQNQISDLKKEYKEATNLENYAKYNYDLTRISYRVSYKSDEFIIYGGENKGYNINYAVVNENGLVGIIKEVYKESSKVKILTSINNLSVKINDSYGTLREYQDGLYKVTDITNYEKVRLNDLVYTSNLGTIKETIYIGYVYKIEENDISKTVYIKNNVDFNHLSYLYVVGAM